MPRSLSVPRASVILFPGTNRNQDAAYALEKAGFETGTVWHKDTALPKTDLVVLPGGFSYGDYLRTGAMAVQSSIMRDVIRHAERGGRVLGICNGFQILCESGLLPGALLRNNHLKFNCKFVHLQVASSPTDYVSAYRPSQVIRVPIAHGDGNYTADKDTLARLKDDGSIAFTYCSANGEHSDAINNPNGSMNDIAGIYNRKKTVLGLMPHPENAVEEFHGSTDGHALFKSIFEALA